MTEIDRVQQPTCLGFIMDGNRRWAKEQGLSSLEGHRAGGEALKHCVSWLKETAVTDAIFYAFSTENWQRSIEEVSYLMKLFEQELKAITQLEMNVRIVGDRKRFSTGLLAAVERVEVLNTDGNQKTIWLTVSYGGRAEIVAAANAAIAAGQTVTEETFEMLLATAELPDPDMIIRTGGEQRLSNFLTWKSTYSELHFIEKHWPALTQDDFADILVEYASRQRRRGR